MLLSPTKMTFVQNVKIKGFKSIAEVDLKLDNMNVIIGANGSGKSNLIGVFRFLQSVLSKNLQLTLGSEPDRYLHHGQKVTPSLSLEFALGSNAYGFTLRPSLDTLIFETEWAKYDGSFSNNQHIAAGHKESKLEDAALAGRPQIPQYVFSKVQNLVVYHFHDTSNSSPAKQPCAVDDNRTFRTDAANLPAYLYWLQQMHPSEFRQIEEHITLVAPFFEGFVLAPSKLNENRIKLEWRQKGSDAYFDAHSLSDGTLRFICLATLLMQPAPPPLIVLDEPELGLHPFAIRVLAEMLEAASNKAQIILATQSVTLLNNFPPKAIIVAENDGLKTSFQRLVYSDLAHWLADFGIGELWEKNVLGGRP